MVIGTPMKAPNRPHRKVQKKIANSTTVGDIDKHAAGNARLDIAADHELDDVEAGEDAENRLPALELRHRQQGGKQRRDEGADERECS